MQENSLTVVKVGGGAGIDPSGVCTDVAAWATRGRPVVLVHGASHRANILTKARGLEPRFLTSPSGHRSRYTDPQAREIFVQAAQEANEEIVALLRGLGAVAVGMTGDRVALRAVRKQALRAVVDGRTVVVRDDYSGRITGIDEGSLRSILAAGQVPVIPPLARSTSDGLLNVDGDRAAASVAAALGAESLLIFSNVPGLMRHYPHENSLVSMVDRDQMDQAMSWAQGRMKRKVLSVRQALDAGVRRVVLADARPSHPLVRAIEGEGTWFNA
ncbi:MAG: [LysW]-aminoadipate kinase [Chloroflexi bacterium]|nr:[LysW]-aminoadipate kinase [Chloroflexota bacterium]